jgi:hypothetical protein
MDLEIGKPTPQRTSVIIDTGSRLVGFPCSECAHCGEHLDKAFDASQSETARWFDCSTDCSDTCDDSNKCPYKETYAEGSSISGYWFEDWVSLGDSNEQNPAVLARLGCHMSENKLFYTQKANGIMGLAPTTGSQSQPTILQNLFADTEHVKKDVFSICLADWGGRLTVGGWNNSYHSPPGDESIEWVSMRASHYYFLEPQSLTLGEADKAAVLSTLPADFGVTIVDSGTTYTYLPEGVYQKAVDAINAYCAANDGCGADPDQEHEMCWMLRDGGAGPVQFPTLYWNFGTARPISWAASSYLHERGEEGRWCQTFMQNNIFQTVLGISFMLHKDFIFDVGNNKLGVAEANCPEYHEQPSLDLQAKFSVNTVPRQVAEPRLGHPMRDWIAPSRMDFALTEAVKRPSWSMSAMAVLAIAVASLGACRATSLRRRVGGPCGSEASSLVDASSDAELPGRLLA